MKHLKLFEGFDRVVTEYNLQDLSDIFDEVRDMGHYTARVMEKGYGGYAGSYQIVIDSQSNGTKRWLELREYVTRAIEYITDVIGTPSNEITLFVNGTICSGGVESIESAARIRSIGILYNYKRSYFLRRLSVYNKAYRP